VIVMLISGPHLDLTVADDRLLLGRADARIAACGGLQHRDELLDPEHAEVRDRERAALEIRQLQLAVAGAADELGAAAAISWIVPPVASRITGTTRPFGAATAMPTCADGKRRILSAGEVGVHRRVAYERGCADLRAAGR
jgi:hypothetical protein